MENSNNDMLILGVIILVIGLFVGSYSLSTYSEIKTLDSKIDFEELEQNNEMSTTDKYYKYLSYSDFLNQKLEKNKNILIKNSSCVYLDYAQHNAIGLYKLTDRRIEQDESRQNVAAGNIRNLYNMLDNYKTCSQSSKYKTELQNLLDEIQNNNLAPANNDIQIFNSYKQNTKTNTPQEDFQDPRPELDPIENPDNFTVTPKEY